MENNNAIFVSELKSVRELFVVTKTDGGGCEYCEGDPR